jgi:hypothetical protein
VSRTAGAVEVAATLGNLGNIQQQLGRLDEARLTMNRAHQIVNTTYGPDHPHT